MENESLSSPGSSSRYIIADDDCDRVYLALQNRSAALCVIHCGHARIANRTYGRGERQPHKVYGIINKRAKVHTKRRETIPEIKLKRDVIPEMKYL